MLEVFFFFLTCQFLQINPLLSFLYLSPFLILCPFFSPPSLFLPLSPSLTLARIPLAQGTLLYRPNPEATQLKGHGGIKGPSSPQLYGGKSPPNPSLYLNKSPSALIHLRFENKKEKEEEKKRAKRG